MPRAEKAVSERAAWWALILLTATYTFSFVDRQIINLLVDPIRADLSLSDSEVSFLQGLAFVMPYVLLSIPIGRIVDRANRIRVLIIGILVWTVSCISCGLARNFWQLGVARVGVGAGEASVTPASWSLLADYFPEEKRALPVSLFLMGPYLGAGLSLILGAEVIAWASGLGTFSLPLIGALAPWQLTFMLVALPGLCMALLLPLLTEPVRSERLTSGNEAMSWRAARDFIWPRRGLFGAYLLGAPFVVLVLYALQAWVPSLLIRGAWFGDCSGGTLLRRDCFARGVGRGVEWPRDVALPGSTGTRWPCAVAHCLVQYAPADSDPCRRRTRELADRGAGPDLPSELLGNVPIGFVRYWLTECVTQRIARSHGRLFCTEHQFDRARSGACERGFNQRFCLSGFSGGR